MAGYSLETSECTSAIHAQQIIWYRSAVIQLWATYFFISCVKCLWDAVGNFLGNLTQAQDARPVWPCGNFTLPGISTMCNRFK